MPVFGAIPNRSVALLITILGAGAWGLCLAQGSNCADCHDPSPDPQIFADSSHGFLGCVDCHTAAAEFPHSGDPKAVDCASCHEQQVAEYGSSVHGQARAKGEAEAPGCTSCHGDIHSLVPRSESSSPVHPLRLPETCGQCHSNPEMVAKFDIPVATPIEAYLGSVHSRKTEEGREAATCSSCHGSHAIFAASDPRSSVFHPNVPDTCGSCHAEIDKQYQESVHGRAVRHGAREAPVCTDCHGEHRILAPDVESSPVYASNIPKMTCGRCHGDLRLADKYDMPAAAVPAYEDSYHGLASRSGSLSVANCASCHGVHDILPSSDPRSHVASANLPATCGKCHSGAGERYAIGAVHVLATEPRHAAVYWVRWVYLWLIVGTIGGMLLHNGLDLVRKVRSRSFAVPPQPVRPSERMLPGFRLAHACLIVSFVVLVYTGFALKYPESFWAAPLLAWEDRFGFRGLLHRSAAVLMLGALAIHIVHLMLSRRARRCIAGMKPGLHDLVELRERVSWFVGRRPEAPKSPLLGYPEKAEYLALMWGIVVMTITGFMLWFENPMLRWFPKWVGDVATAIHFYEAILASLAIVVWHFYFVIFDPLVYPMDLAWLTGREHPARAAERSSGSSSALVGGSGRVDGDIERRHRA
jgi:cytochrome b subunit of formate dehydrogenase